MKLNVLPDINNTLNPHPYKLKHIIKQLDISSYDELNNILLDYQIKSTAKKTTLMYSLCEVEDKHFKKEFFTGVGGVSIDIDDGIKIQEFMKKFPYEHILYTTHSHSDLGDHRFRVVLMLDKFISSSLYDGFIKGLKLELERLDIPYDSSTFAKTRCMVFPPKGSLILHNPGKPLDISSLYLEGSKIVPDVDAVITRSKAKSLKRDCSSFTSIKKYLTTSYSSLDGNGDSNSSLYKAIYCCVKNEDDDTLDKIIDKALSEGWTIQELEYKILSAEN